MIKLIYSMIDQTRWSIQWGGGIRRCTPQVAHLVLLRKIYMHSAWAPGALMPSVADTLALKQCSRVHPNTPFSFKKMETCSEQGDSPSPVPTGTGGDTPSRTYPLSASGAQPLAAVLAPLSKILNTPLIRHKNEPRSLWTPLPLPQSFIALFHNSLSDKDTLCSCHKRRRPIYRATTSHYHWDETTQTIINHTGRHWNHF